MLTWQEPLSTAPYILEQHMVRNNEDAYRIKNVSLLLLNVAITEARKTKNMGKTGFYGLSPCRGNAVE